MHRKCKIAFALAIALAGPRWASAQVVSSPLGTPTQAAPVTTPASALPRPSFGNPIITVVPDNSQSPVQKTAQPAPKVETPAPVVMESEAAPAPDAPLGPTPLLAVGILQKMIFGDDDKAKLKIAGWLDADYTFRSTGHGVNGIAPVMNRFGDEPLLRQLGVLISRPLDPTCWSWGFRSGRWWAF